MQRFLRFQGHSIKIPFKNMSCTNCQRTIEIVIFARVQVQRNHIVYSIFDVSDTAIKLSRHRVLFLQEYLCVQIRNVFR